MRVKVRFWVKLGKQLSVSDWIYSESEVQMATKAAWGSATQDTNPGGTDVAQWVKLRLPPLAANPIFRKMQPNLEAAIEI